MKHSLKFPILFTLIAISACRSHKTVEVSNYSTNDSCIVQTDLRVHSLSNIEKNESITTRIAQDLMEFSDGAGEILIHSNGEVSIKGLKSAHITRHDTHKQSATTDTTSDSITAKTQTKSIKTRVATSKSMATNPTFSSTWLRILFFVGLILIFVLSMRSVLKRFFN